MKNKKVLLTLMMVCLTIPLSKAGAMNNNMNRSMNNSYNFNNNLNNSNTATTPYVDSHSNLTNNIQSHNLNGNNNNVINNNDMMSTLLSNLSAINNGDQFYIDNMNNSMYSINNDMNNSMYSIINDMNNSMYNINNNMNNSMYSINNDMNNSMYSIINDMNNSMYSINNDMNNSMYSINNDMNNSMYSINNGMNNSMYSINNNMNNSMYSIINDMNSSMYSINNDMNNSMSSINNDMNNSIYSINNNMNNNTYNILEKLRSECSNMVNHYSNLFRQHEQEFKNNKIDSISQKISFYLDKIEKRCDRLMAKKNNSENFVYDTNTLPSNNIPNFENLMKSLKFTVRHDTFKEEEGEDTLMLQEKTYREAYYLLLVKILYILLDMEINDYEFTKQIKIYEKIYEVFRENSREHRFSMLQDKNNDYFKKIFVDLKRNNTQPGQDNVPQYLYATLLYMLKTIEESAPNDYISIEDIYPDI